MLERIKEIGARKRQGNKQETILENMKVNMIRIILEHMQVHMQERLQVIIQVRLQDIIQVRLPDIIRVVTI